MTSRKQLVESRFDWAKQHIKTLEDEVRIYLKERPYRLEVQPNRNHTEYTFRVRVKKRPPDHWPYVISDITHNFRATLDNLAFNLAGSPASERGERAQFPIVHPGKKGGRPAFDKAAKRTLDGVHPDAISIIESLQPYHAKRLEPTRALRLLSFLSHMSNVDKHRVPLVGFGDVNEVSMQSLIPPSRIVPLAPRFLEDNAVVAKWYFDRPNVNVKLPSAHLEIMLRIPWRWGRYSEIPLDICLIGLSDLIENHILTPLRPYMRK
jgi:hypothetical protein